MSDSVAEDECELYNQFVREASTAHSGTVQYENGLHIEMQLAKHTRSSFLGGAWEALGMSSSSSLMSKLHLEAAEACRYGCPCLIGRVCKMVVWVMLISRWCWCCR